MLALSRVEIPIVMFDSYFPDSQQYSTQCRCYLSCDTYTHGMYTITTSTDSVMLRLLVP